MNLKFKISRINIDQLSSSAPLFTQLSPSGVSSVAYHSRKNLTLWADAMQDKIMSVSGDGNTSAVVGHGIVGLKTIQVDHVTDKVYW